MAGPPAMAGRRVWPTGRILKAQSAGKDAFSIRPIGQRSQLELLNSDDSFRQFMTAICRIVVEFARRFDGDESFKLFAGLV